MKSILWFVFLCCLLTGCRANEDSIQQFIEQAHSQALVQIEPLQEQYVFAADEFVMVSNRVPFIRPHPEPQSVEQEKDTTCWQPDMARTRTELEVIPLELLKMKGVIGDDKELWAIISRPDGKLEKVRNGYYLGVNFGKVKQVSPSRVEIEEVLPDGVGCWLKRLTTLPLASEDSAV